MRNIKSLFYYNYLQKKKKLFECGNRIGMEARSTRLEQKIK